MDFKGKAKAFTRTYDFLGTILPYTNPDWEKLSIFLAFLIPKLPAPREEDLSRGIIEIIDMDSYRAEARSSLEITLADEEGEIGPVPDSPGGRKHEPELGRLSNILRDFNELFGNIEWKDADSIQKVIAEEIPARVSADRAYQNAIQNSGRENARVQHDKALENAVTDLVSDHTELFRQFYENPSFQQWLSNTVFSMTYDDPEISTTSRRRRRAGSAAGRIIIHDNFDDPLPDDILEVFERRGF